MNTKPAFQLTLAIIQGLGCGRVVDEGCAGLCLSLYHHPRGVVVLVAGDQLAILAGTSRDLRRQQDLLLTDVVTALRSQKIASSSCLMRKL